MKIQFNRKEYRLSASGMGNGALAIGLLGVVASILGWLSHPQRFLKAYLVAYAFVVTIALGALFFVMLHHLTGSVWSVVLRRISEQAATLLIPALIFFLPIAFNLSKIYPWAQPHAEVLRHLEAGKRTYLGTPFFLIRSVVYLLAWAWLALALWRASRREDAGDMEKGRGRFIKISGPGMFVFAFTITFAGFDWLMSLDPVWYSTIFGVYIFTSAFVAFLTFLIVFLWWLRLRDGIDEVITLEHFHDLGRLLFAFIVFWAYIGGAQYFLIWYANLPEETHWYLARWFNGWKGVSLALVFLHFVLPFSVLAFYANKRRLFIIVPVAAIVLAMHYVNMYWLVMPGLFGQKVPFDPQWVDLAPLLALAGLWLGIFLKRLPGEPLVPVNDPHLMASINFKH